MSFNIPLLRVVGAVLLSLSVISAVVGGVPQGRGRGRGAGGPPPSVGNPGNPGNSIPRIPGTNRRHGRGIR